MAAVFGGGMAVSAQAASCGYEHCWGAVAVGERGVAARASAHRTAPDAVARVLRVCGSRCSVVESFVDGCAAIVQDSTRTTFSGFAITRHDAEAEAMAACAGNGTGSKVCRPRVWACSE